MNWGKKHRWKGQIDISTVFPFSVDYSPLFIQLLYSLQVKQADMSGRQPCIIDLQPLFS